MPLISLVYRSKGEEKAPGFSHLQMDFYSLWKFLFTIMPLYIPDANCYHGRQQIYFCWMPKKQQLKCTHLVAV